MNELAELQSADMSAEQQAASRYIAKFLLQIVNPFMPHLTETLWQQMGMTPCLTDTPWPVVDEMGLEEETVTIGVQINGKLRATIDAPTNADRDQLIALAKAEENIMTQLQGKTIKKAIAVPGRIVNFAVQ